MQTIGSLVHQLEHHEDPDQNQNDQEKDQSVLQVVKAMLPDTASLPEPPGFVSRTQGRQRQEGEAAATMATAQQANEDPQQGQQGHQVKGQQDPPPLGHLDPGEVVRLPLPREQMDKGPVAEDSPQVATQRGTGRPVHRQPTGQTQTSQS